MEGNIDEHLSEEQREKIRVLREERDGLRKRIGELSREIEGIIYSYPLGGMQVGEYIRFTVNAGVLPGRYIGRVKDMFVMTGYPGKGNLVLNGNFIYIPFDGAAVMEDCVEVDSHCVHDVLASVEVVGKDGAIVMIEGMKDQICEGFLNSLGLTS